MSTNISLSESTSVETSTSGEEDLDGLTEIFDTFVTVVESTDSNDLSSVFTPVQGLNRIVDDPEGEEESTSGGVDSTGMMKSKSSGNVRNVISPTRQGRSLSGSLTGSPKASPFLGSDRMDQRATIDVDVPTEIKPWQPSPGARSRGTLIGSTYRVGIGSVSSPTDSGKRATVDDRPSLTSKRKEATNTLDSTKKYGLTRVGSNSSPTKPISSSPYNNKSLSPLPSSVVCDDEPCLIQGEMKILGKKKWVRLTFFKLEIWTSGGPQNSSKSFSAQRISLGFKQAHVDHDNNKRIIITDVLRGTTIALEPLPSSQELTNEWLNEIVGVINFYRLKVIREDKFQMDNWITQKVKVWAGTWNVGNAIPQGDLSSWLPSKDYDIIAVGVQECKYTPIGPSVGEDWFGRVISTVGDEYFVLARESLWEIRNIILVRKELSGFIHSVEISTLARGIANTLGNKGAVAIKLSMYDTSFCFVTAHLAAHQEFVEARNTDYLQIASQLKFQKFGRSDISWVNDCNVCFFYGDLNYRIDKPRDHVLDVIAQNNLSSLIEHDQLYKEKLNGRTFVGWNEEFPKFKPTYRFVKNGVDAQDNRIYSEQKMRVPSWCDRVLWKSYPSTKVKLLQYDSVDKVITSDHSPVFASFEVECLLQHSAIYALLNEPLKTSNISVNPSPPPTNRARSSNIVKPRIIFSDFTVVSLAQVGQRVPNIYVKFVSNFIPNSRKNRTLVEKQTAAPHWDKIDPIMLIATEKEYIEAQHVICVVVDEPDYGNCVSLGQAIVPLTGACADTPVNFKVPIIANGKEGGEISGSVMVLGAESVVKRIESVKQQTLT
eukprot:TRINITY_DN4116_c1_g1_i1.p1 TRINITY_DN4116_c1_g1~~TRINITY_DN4116_c1_g1_i1.p1  ORF type:complete len:827 (+),score=164.84 TRINITY_DN4116_c1_g1_i1:19-2499(+)